MSYLIRSKGLRLEMRDRGAPGQPMRQLSTESWVAFVELPAGVDADSGEVEIREVAEAEPEPVPVEAAQDTRPRFKKRRG